MLRWLSSKHRRTGSSASIASTTSTSLHRISLDLPVSSEHHTTTAAAAAATSAAQRSASVAAPPEHDARHGKSLRRRSLPALHLQEDDQSEAMMLNPPIFTNPLRRRGCCDHQHTQQLTSYRAEAIHREQATEMASFGVTLPGSFAVPLEAS